MRVSSISLTDSALKHACCSVFTVYEIPLPITATDETEMYARLQRPAMPEIHDNSSAATTATGTDATAADDDYEIPIPTEVAPPPPDVNTHETNF